MSLEAVIAVQAISLVFSILSVVGCIVLVLSDKFDWRVLYLPILLMLNLSFFLASRLLAKTTGVVIPILGEHVNVWSVFLQLQLALTAAAAIWVTWYNHRLNGYN